ncbi:PQQ-binding-like beta-propeller repeat protein, partial [Streptomyces sp. NPDC005899]|uniref:outer membrane protein assembly factor BamB family protein n=1 Tax=Streptomyces sp. NPDC005899 TaxID=3155716 RepID=UPI0033D10A61
GAAADAPDTGTTHVRAADGLPSAPGAWRGRRPRRRLATAAAVLAALAAGCAWAAGAWGEGPGPSAPGSGGGGPDRAASFEPWRTPLRSPDGSTPSCAPAGSALYCAAAGYGTARLDPSDGRVLWSRRSDLSGDAELGTLPGGPAYTAEPGGQLLAYAPGQGEPAWRTSLSGSPDTPFPAGGTLLMTGRDGTARGLDPATGGTRWRHAVPGHLRPAYALYDDATGLAYLFENDARGATTLVTAVEADTGRTAWQRRLAGMLTPVGTSGGDLLLTSMNDDAQTTGLVRYDPARRSTARVPLPFRMNAPGVAVTGDTAVLLERGGTLLAVDIRPGGGPAERWRLETAVGLTSAPVAGGDGRLYFSAADGRLLAVDTERGALLGQTRPRLRDGKLGHASSLPAPVVLGRSVVATAPDGSVFAVDADDPAHW